MKNYPNKIPSLEFMRVIAMIAIIIIHTGLFTDTLIINGNAWLANIANQLSRFAVPLFFLIAGFLIQPKLMTSPLLVIRKYNAPLLKVWLVWTVICLLLPTNLQNVIELGYLGERQLYWQFLLKTPLNSLLEGGLVHLWFLPALIIAVAIVGLFTHFKQLKLLLPVAIMLYLYGVLAGSYASLTDIGSPFLTRNGPFFSLLMLTIGFEIRRFEVKLSAQAALLLLCIGLLGHFLEAYWLFTKGVPFSGHDLLLFTPLWASGLFLYLLAKPKMGDHPLTYWLSKSILPIYLCHLSIAIIFFNIVGIFALSGVSRDALLFFGTTICSVAFVKLIEKTPLQNILFR
ncbi:acyltransferase family protein [Psychromonas hadalis]|uniref:acyltransferase family protein n=1 Tax=Psychromonas hadalis TaxID=211669 RepID=UPI0003B6BFAB|nr:acyltransferase family protein [Psychromonas hadalis]